MVEPTKTRGGWVNGLLDGEGGSIHFLDDRDTRRIRYSVDREVLRKRAQAKASALRAAGLAKGAKILIALPTGADNVAWLLGAMWAGMTPMPMPSPLRGWRGRAGIDRLTSVVNDAAPEAIIAEPRTRTALRRLGVEAIWLDPERASDQPIEGHVPARGEAAFIQYTAGSTGAPKGVVVTYDNLSANLQAIGNAVEVTRDDRVISWLPLYHDMGLVGTLLFSLYWRLNLYLYSPIGFALDPPGWLRAISAHRGTLSAAPHFAYSLCAAKVRDESVKGIDLSSWRLALDGSEPVRAHNVRAFCARYERYGFRPTSYHPVYGLSEATLAVAFPRPGEGAHILRLQRDALSHGEAIPALNGGADVAEIVSVGRPLQGLRVTVCARSSDKILPDGEVGEIRVEGPSVSPRYLGSRGKDRVELRTGDLGFMLDGRMYVVDRSKDLIIHAGANVYPGDVETAAGTVPGLRKGRIVAFGVEGSGTEEVVVVAECKDGVDLRAAEDAVRKEILRRCGVNVFDVKLVKARSLPLTTSGKLMRSKTRQLYAQAGLVPYKRSLKARLGLGRPSV